MNLSTIKDLLSHQGIKIAHVVAHDNNRCIGNNNQLPWHVPEDLQHFKTTTTGGVVLMGRKTFESMGRALPKRINWVITRDKHWITNQECDHSLKVAHSISDALISSLNDVKRSAQPNTLFIIGGGEIFTQTLPICDTLYVSCIDVNVVGDAFYPAIPSDFCLIDQVSGISAKNGIGYRFETYEHKRK